MSRKHGYALGLLTALVVLASAVISACEPPQRRNDWRYPSPAVPADAAAPSGGDAGAAPGQAPLPSHQPSSSDIQI